MSDDKIKSLLELYSKMATSEDESKKQSNTSMDALKAILASYAASDKISKDEKAEILKKRYEAFTKKNIFTEGTLVKWKPGLKNKTGPDYDEVAIVVESLKDPIFDQDKDSGSPYFKEPLDLIIAFIDSDNDFITLHVDSRRLQPNT